MLNIVSSKARGEGSDVGQERLHQARRRQRQSCPAQEIANWLHLPLTKAIVRRFADMEIFVEIQENVRGSDVFIIQSTSYPANDHLMELLIITDALRRASARRITAVIPYFGYARQDRKVGSRSADFRQAGGEYHHPRWRRSRDDARPARRSDPGLLRHSDRQSLRLAGDGARHQGTLRPCQDHGGVARRRRRGARARPCQAHQRAAGDHRQAA